MGEGDGKDRRREGVGKERIRADDMRQADDN